MLNENPLRAEARESTHEHETPVHELTAQAASELFAEFGVPRSRRSVQGFCKEGHLDCVRVKGPTGDQYFVNRQSVERYAIELKQIEAVGKMSGDEPFAQEREHARDSAHSRAEAVSLPISTHEPQDDRVEKLTQTIKALRKENLNLKIDNRGKEQFINQIVQDRNGLLQSVQDVQYRLGAAETRLQQLEAPRERARNSTHVRAEAREAETETVIETREPEIESAANFQVPSAPPVRRKVFGIF